MRRNPNIKLMLWRRRHEIAPVLDKRPQSQESDRSGFNRSFRFPI